MSGCHCNHPDDLHPSLWEAVTQRAADTRTCEAGWEGSSQVLGNPGRETARNSWKDDSALEARCVPAHDDFSRGESLSPGSRLTGCVESVPRCREPAEPYRPLTQGLLWRPSAEAPSKHLSHRQTREKDEEGGWASPARAHPNPGSLGQRAHPQLACGQEAQGREERAPPLVRPERACCPVPLDPRQSPTTFTQPLHRP